MEIEHNYGPKQCEKLLQSLLNKILEPCVIKQLLQNINKQKWILDERTLKILNEEPSSKWLEAMSHSFMSNQERNVYDLVALMSRNFNNSLAIRENLTHIQNLVKMIEKSRSNPFSPKCEDAELCEVIAKIDRAIWQKHGFYLRSTQLLAVLTFLKTDDKGVLEQVSTGEGKSLIIVALAIVKALQGESVDVITSSSVLAGT